MPYTTVMGESRALREPENSGLANWLSSSPPNFTTFTYIAFCKKALFYVNKLPKLQKWLLLCKWIEELSILNN